VECRVDVWRAKSIIYSVDNWGTLYSEEKAAKPRCMRRGWIFRFLKRLQISPDQILKTYCDCIEYGHMTLPLLLSLTLLLESWLSDGEASNECRFLHDNAAKVRSCIRSCLTSHKMQKVQIQIRELFLMCL
jgi:hypothetical protein